MARVKFNPALGISSITGKLGNFIFYTRNGKQFVRRKRADIEPTSSQSRGVFECQLDVKRKTTKRP